MNLLEPAAPDSLARWGFFNAIFEEKEYAEHYVLESLAREMLANDPALSRSLNNCWRWTKSLPPVLRRDFAFSTNVRPTGIHK
jgi:hypothetical protein